MVKKLFLIIACYVCVLILIAVAYSIPYFRFVEKTLGISLIKTLQSDGSLAPKQETINILLLGTGGANHDGPNLTDSITLVHINFASKSATTLGIPRDIWSDSLEQKINAAYAFGLEDGVAAGYEKAKKEIGDAVGVSIDYVAVLDFSEFEKIIDAVGGVDITVETAFTDPEFPIAGKENDLCGGDFTYACRFEKVTFNKGPQHMDGKRALTFIRSRHAEGDDGTDYARSRRQQLVLASLKSKMYEVVQTASLQDWQKLYTTVDQAIKRDFTNQQAATILRNLMTKTGFTLKGAILDEDLFEVPTDPKYLGLYVLTPKTKTKEEFHAIVLCLLQGKSDTECVPQEYREESLF